MTVENGRDAVGTAVRPLKAAREARGWSLDDLSTQLKVPASRLAALEDGRWQDLPDGPYARALAKTVCRSLGVDEGPVLRELPDLTGSPLEQVNTGLNQPFRDPRQAPSSLGRSPWLWAALLILMGGVALAWFWPWAEIDSERSDAGVVTPASAAILPSAPTPASVTVPATQSLASAAMPAMPSGPAVASPTTPPLAAPEASSVRASGPPLSSPSVGKVVGDGTPAALRLKARQAAWVSVVDARGQAVLSRLLSPGEVVDLQVAAPSRVTLGNAPDTELAWRGQVVDVSANAQQRVARLELR